MADLSITVANVIAGTDAQIDKTALAGEAIIQGKNVYKSATTKKWMLADSNSATAEAREADGIALNSALLNQPLAVQTGGSLTTGATMTAGVQYYTSDTPGGICPVADVGSGEYVGLVYLATSTTVARINYDYSGVAL